MKEYRFSPSMKAMYDRICAAIEQGEVRVSNPDHLDFDRVFLLIRKAIAACRNGWQYNPTKLSSSGSDFFIDRVKDGIVRAVDSQIREAAAAANGCTNDYDRVRAVYEYFVRNYSYSRSNLPEDHLFATVFTKKKAVCEGFCIAFTQVMNALGIPSGVVIGKGHRSGHGWNVVKVGAFWYHVDVTWDICLKAGGKLKYFLMSDTRCRKEDHDFREDPTIPPCIDSSLYRGLKLGAHDGAAGETTPAPAFVTAAEAKPAPRPFPKLPERPPVPAGRTSTERWTTGGRTGNTSGGASTSGGTPTVGVKTTMGRTPSTGAHRSGWGRADRPDPVLPSQTLKKPVRFKGKGCKEETALTRGYHLCSDETSLREEMRRLIREGSRSFGFCLADGAGREFLTEKNVREIFRQCAKELARYYYRFTCSCNPGAGVVYCTWE